MRLPNQTLPVVLFSTFLLATATFLMGVATDSWLLRMVSKPLPVGVLVAWALLHQPRDRSSLPLAIGLALGIGGDVLLEASASTFLPGLVSFLLGHIAYCVAFSRAARRLGLAQAAPLVLYVVAAALALVPSLGDMGVPVVLYMVAISAMAWRTAALAEARGGWAWAALAGAVLFIFSDTLIALNAFVAPIDGVRPAIILTYWAGQAGIAAGLLLSRDP